MPELPEMEIYRTHLERHALARQILAVEIGREKSLNVPASEFAAALEGQSFTAFSRRGKHLVFHLSDGRYLLNHLMLGGAIFCGAPDEARNRTFQVILRLDDGQALYWSGLRLGWLHLLDAAGLEERTLELGVDPLSAAFTAEHVGALVHKRRGALKPLLVDQKRFPGIGNCYSDEACWEARIHPLRIAGSLSALEAEQLWAGMRQTLTQAVAMGGYTETPFVTGDTFSGGYIPHLKVYDRQGEGCRRCGAPIVLAVASGRKVFFCPACQPARVSDQPEAALAARAEGESSAFATEPTI